MASPSHVLVVENESDAGPFMFEQWLAAADVAVEICRPYAGDPLPVAVRHDGLIVLGGEMGACDDHKAPWLAPLRTMLARAVSDNKAVLGICLGAQLLATACGGQVKPSRTGGELGLGTIELNDNGRCDRLFAAMVSPALVVQWHNDEVTQLPAGGVLLASSEECEIQAYRVGDRAWGVQFHPEVTSAAVKSWANHETQREDATRVRLKQAVDDVKASESCLLACWQGFAERFASVLAGR